MRKPYKNKKEDLPLAKPLNKPARKPVIVLHVEDDPNDATLMQVACAKAAVDFQIQNLEDGFEVIDYLSGAGKYADRTRYDIPGLVLLDLKMSRATGLEVLKWIRSQTALKTMPVIVLSGSELQEDKTRAFQGGANSYLVKPPSFTSLVSMVKEIGAQLPALPHPAIGGV